MVKLGCTGVAEWHGVSCCKACSCDFMLCISSRLPDHCANSPPGRHYDGSPSKIAIGHAGQNHLVKDERRQISEDAACSTAFVGEESPLRPAGARSASARAAGSALAPHSSAATERSADLDAEDGSSIEEITGALLLS